MKSKMHKLLNLSISQLCELVLNPWRIGVLKDSPCALLPEEMISVLFPEVPYSEIKSCRLALLNNERFFSEINNAMVKTRGRRLIFQEANEFIYLLVRFA